mgnify:CR=1 FL=1
MGFGQIKIYPRQFYRQFGNTFRITFKERKKSWRLVVFQLRPVAVGHLRS